jgi:hypothetical protein
MIPIRDLLAAGRPPEDDAVLAQVPIGDPEDDEPGYDDDEEEDDDDYEPDDDEP